MKKWDGYFIRGVVYIAIALIGLGYELVFVRPVRSVALFLWTGLFSIGVFVIFTLKEPSD